MHEDGYYVLYVDTAESSPSPCPASSRATRATRYTYDMTTRHSIESFLRLSGESVTKSPVDSQPPANAYRDPTRTWPSAHARHTSTCIPSMQLTICFFPRACFRFPTTMATPHRTPKGPLPSLVTVVFAASPYPVIQTPDAFPMLRPCLLYQHVQQADNASYCHSARRRNMATLYHAPGVLQRALSTDIGLPGGNYSLSPLSILDCIGARQIVRKSLCSMASRLPLQQQINSANIQVQTD
ncbi:hypothetical protein HRG_014760 [Hirsutella rhossiliensis]